MTLYYTMAKYRDSPRYRVSSDCKARGIDRYDDVVRRCRSRTLYDFTRATRVCINKAPFGAQHRGVYELPDVQPMRRCYKSINSGQGT